MADYKSIKIAEEIIIVERQCEYRSWVTWREVKGQGLHQGYVVDAGNKKMLATAMKWAEYHVYDESKRPTEAPYNWDAYYDSAVIIPGIQHTYKNGFFEITLCDSADNSSQSGKLSFWNCIIKAPDGKEFLVGINADILLELLLANTFEQGKCKSKVYLGRIGGSQVGAFTPNMELYAQAQKDEQSRQENAKAGNKYVPGDIVKTLTETQVYLGEVYCLGELSASEGWYREPKKLITYKEPQKRYVFISYYDNEISEYLNDYNIKKTKPKRVIAGHIDLSENAYDYIKKYAERDIKKYPQSYYSDDYKLRIVQYTESLADVNNKVATMINTFRDEIYTNYAKDVVESD